jgi:Tol biopolymer transport system component
MTTFERFEESIPRLMDELAPASRPDYFDDLLRTTAAHRQRPAWTSPERWLPVDLTARPLLLRTIPWRPVLIVVIVAVAIVAGVVAIAGSRPALPAPFGPAGNGLFIYRTADGAIVTLDPVTRAQATVAPASAGLGDPIPSRDGRRIAFAATGPGQTSIVVRDLDGLHPTTLAGTYRDVDRYDWSPDDAHLAFTSAQRDSVAITVAATDGSGATTLALGRDVRDLWYLPDGRLAIIAAEEPGRACARDEGTGPSECALFVVRADGTGLDKIDGGTTFEGLGLSPSPDGTKAVYVEWSAAAQGRLHLVDLLTHEDRRLPVTDPPAVYEMNHAWFSPDGSRILFDEFLEDGDYWGAIPAAGGQIVRMGPRRGPGPSDADWAPSGESVLAFYGSDSGSGQLWLLDPTGHGGDRQLDLDLPGLPAWQRVAPRPAG